MKFTLEVVTAEGRVLSREADFLLAPGLAGELGILPRHIPLLTPLRTGELKIENDGDDDYYFVSGGFLEVTPDRVVVLADATERADDIDEARAQAARQRAEDALREKVIDAEAAASLERALFRLRVAETRKRHRERAGHQVPR